MKMISLLAVFLILVSLSAALACTARSQEPARKDYIVMFRDLFGEETFLKYGTPKRDLDIIDGAVAELTEEEADSLESHGMEVFENYRVKTLLKDSVPLIRADEVRSMGHTGQGAIVCVVDTGVDDDHDYLNPLVGEYDFVNLDGDATDDNGHGTHVAGIIASQHPEYTGVAPDSGIMAAKVMDASGSGWASDVIAGIEWCVDNGADVITLSLGGGLFSGTCDYDPIANSVNNAVGQGVVVVAAAGNEGPSGMTSPGCASGAISVGAADNEGTVWIGSSRGSELDVVAPGVDIISAYSNPQYPNSWAYGTGTSMATPHVSGIAAQVLGLKPWISPREIRIAIERTTDPVGACEMLTCYGDDCYVVKRDSIYCGKDVRGWGMVNAYKAYLYVKTLNGPPDDDTDGDGIPDSSDVCPNTMGDFCNGCPEPDCSGCRSPSCPGEGTEPVCEDDDSLCSAPDAEGACGGGECSFVCDPGFGNCDSDWENGCETDLDNDQNNCGSCGNACGEIICEQEDGCGAGICSEDEYGSYPENQQQTCAQGACEGECVPDCEYDRECDPDDDDDGVMDSLDQCPLTFGEDCNGCPDPCMGCGVMVCEPGQPPSCLPDDDLCPLPECPEDGCGAGECAAGEFGTYTPVQSKCMLLNGAEGVCSERGCYLECVYDPMCQPNVMHVKSIWMSTLFYSLRWPPYLERGRAVAEVEVVDALGEPVEKAIVRGSWSGLTQDEDAAWTNSEGKARVYSNWATNPSGTFTFTVGDISKTGWTYDSGSNGVKEGSISV